MLLSAMPIKPQQTGIVSSAFSEKEQPKGYVDRVPVAKKSIFTKEELQHAVTEALKNVSSDSEKTAYVYYDESDVAFETYPSAPNGENLTDSTESTSVKADVVGFFSSLTGKVFGKEKHKIEDVFVVFDKLRSYLKDREYEKLPGFSELCTKTPNLADNLEEMESALSSINDEFKDRSIYKKLDKNVSLQKKQDYLDKRDRVEKGLASLKPVLEDVSHIIGSLKERELSEKQTLAVRVVTGILTFAGYILAICASYGIAVTATPAFLTGFFINIGVDTHQYQLKQEIKKWESFQKTLIDLSEKNPLITEKDVINGLLADQHRMSMQQNAALDNVNGLIADQHRAQMQQAIKLDNISTQQAAALENVDKAIANQTKTVEVLAAELKAKNEENAELKTRVAELEVLVKTGQEESNKKLTEMAETQARILKLLEKKETSESILVNA